LGCKVLGRREDVWNVPFHAVRAIANERIIRILASLPKRCGALGARGRRFLSCDPDMRDVDDTKQLAVGTFDPRLSSGNIDRLWAIATPRPSEAEEELNASLLTLPQPHDTARCGTRPGGSEIKVPRFRRNHSPPAVSRSHLARCAEGVELPRNSRRHTLPCTMYRPVKTAERRWLCRVL